MLIPGLSPLASFLHHPDFLVASNSGQFGIWEETGLDKVGKLFTRLSLIIVVQAKEHLGNFPNFTYQFPQVQHFMKKLLQTADVSRPLTAFEELLASEETKKLSRIYQILINSDQIGAIELDAKM